MTHGWIKRAKEAARPKTEQQQPKEVHRSDKGICNLQIFGQNTGSTSARSGL
jgi:hypothetical protein